MTPRGRPLKTGYITKKVGMNLPECFIKRAHEEELDLTMYFTKILEIRYGERSQDLQNFLEGAPPLQENDNEGESEGLIESILFPNWKEWMKFIARYRNARTWTGDETRPPEFYQAGDKSPEQYIFIKSGGKIVTKGYIRKNWGKIIARKTEYDRKRGGE